MRTLIAGLAVLFIASCTPLDEGGCPLEGRDAVGKSCMQDGLKCGEASLCDPCVSDGTQCEAVACVNGKWAVDEWPSTCDGGVN